MSLFSSPTIGPRLWGGVRLIDHPCPSNVRRIDMGALPLIDQMHSHGIRLDTGHLSRLSATLSELMTGREEKIRTLIGRAINPASPLQVAKLLFQELCVQGDNPVKLTDTGAESTSADNLQFYAGTHPVVDLILEWRQLQKLKSTYTDNLPKMVDSAGRIHTRFKTTTTTTGRLASENPNLQNIPKRGELDGVKLGLEVRKAFVADPGWVLVSMDLSQIEMRIAAHVSGEPVMVEGYRDPSWDMHTQTAMDVFGLPRDKVDKLQHRLPSKTIGFGVLYMMGGPGLQASILNAGGGLWSIERCEALIARFYAARPNIAAWQKEQFRRARRHKMVWTIFGRHRIIPQVRSSLEWVASAGLREGANQPIQGSAQDILKLAMGAQVALVESFNRGPGGERVRPLLQVHDELIYECRGEAVAREWIELVRPTMETLVPLSVPVLSSADVNESWGAMAE